MIHAAWMNLKHIIVRKEVPYYIVVYVPSFMVLIHFKFKVFVSQYYSKVWGKSNFALYWIVSVCNW